MVADLTPPPTLPGRRRSPSQAPLTSRDTADSQTVGSGPSWDSHCTAAWTPRRRGGTCQAWVRFCRNHRAPRRRGALRRPLRPLLWTSALPGPAHQGRRPVEAAMRGDAGGDQPPVRSPRLPPAGRRFFSEEGGFRSRAQASSGQNTATCWFLHGPQPALPSTSPIPQGPIAWGPSRFPEPAKPGATPTPGSQKPPPSRKVLQRAGSRDRVRGLWLQSRVSLSRRGPRAPRKASPSPHPRPRLPPPPSSFASPPSRCFGARRARRGRAKWAPRGSAPPKTCGPGADDEFDFAQVASFILCSRGNLSSASFFLKHNTNGLVKGRVSCSAGRTRAEQPGWCSCLQGLPSGRSTSAAAQ